MQPTPEQIAMVHADVATWHPDKLDTWNERAAILQFDAGHSREQAELLAWGELVG